MIVRIVVGGLLCLGWCAARAEAASNAEIRNVVMIISDDQAWTDFGFMGHEVIQTPHLDRLAAESALFTRGYVPTSLCRASLACMITGLYPHQHKITSNDPPPGVDRTWMLRHMSMALTLPRLLAGAGYLSLQTGKWWEGNYALGGFTHGMTHGDPQRGGRHGDEGLKIGREGLQAIEEFLDTAATQPFFLWYAPMMPHTPHTPPQRFLAKYEAPGRSPKIARYWAMCEWFDESCGQLLEMLDERGLREQTLVVFVVDNGWIQETGPTRTTRGWFAPKSKLSPYDGGLRTPIMLNWPGRISPGRFEEPVSSIDLPPTILAACGQPARPEMPGLNLLETIAGRGPKQRVVFGEIFSHDAVDLDKPSANLTHRWCVDGRWKLILPVRPGAAVELYDVDADPTETRNLADSHRDVVTRLTFAIEEQWPLGQAGPLP